MPPVAAGALVFFTSGAVLVLEILAGRLLAPYVGVTLETYTGIIGTVLAGIAVGTWLGGRLADRYPPQTLLGPLLVAGGALAIAALPAVRMVGSLGLGAGPVAILLLALVGFFLPAAVLSAVSPTVVKLQLDDLGQTGTVVGRLSALATAGAITGTFVTGFLLVSAFPTPPIVIGIGSALVVCGLALWVRRGTRPQGGSRAHADVVRGALLVAVIAGGLSVVLAGPCQVESAYFCARVVADPDRSSGRVLYLDVLRHSYVDLDDPTHLEFTYAQTMGDVLATIAPEGQPLDALHIGGGGFTLPRYIAATRPGSESLVLELDPTIVALARSDLGLETGPELEVRTGDARLGIRGLRTDSYDLVIGDAFGGQAVPWHLTTRELIEDVDRVLRPGGVYAINLIDYPPLGFARAEAATLRTVFDHVAVLAPPARLAGEEGGNFVLVATDGPLPIAAILERNASRGDDEAALSTAAELDAFTAGSPVLTDAYAPVDQLLTPLT